MAVVSRESSFQTRDDGRPKWKELLAIGLFLCAFVSACGSSDPWKSKRPRTVVTTGEVVYKGKPLADAMVTFINSIAARSGSGMTDSMGRFELTTFETGDGVVPGPQEVSIRKVLIDFPGTKLEGMTPTQAQAAMKTLTGAEMEKLTNTPAQARWQIPERYGSPTTSELSVEVVNGKENRFRFELRE